MGDGRTNPSFAPLHAPRTVHDATVTQIRAWIQDGTLRAGDRLHQARLARMLGVSRMPVREAIRQLTAEGLVEQRPRRGAFVASLNPEEIREIYLIRAALESLAAGVAVERIRPEVIERLRALLTQLVAAAADGDDEAIVHLDRSFHDCLYEAAAMPLLMALIEQVRDRSQVFRRAHAHLPGRNRVSNAEHAELLEAVEARNRAGVERLTRVHLINAADHLIAYLTQERRG